MLSVIDINRKAGKALLMSLKYGAAANMLLRTFTARIPYSAPNLYGHSYGKNHCLN